MKNKLYTCPSCGWVADNGHDREMPPNVYNCKACNDLGVWYGGVDGHIEYPCKQCEEPKMKNKHQNLLNDIRDFLFQLDYCDVLNLCNRLDDFLVEEKIKRTEAQTGYREDMAIYAKLLYTATTKGKKDEK